MTLAEFQALKLKRDTTTTGIKKGVDSAGKPKVVAKYRQFTDNTLAELQKVLHDVSIALLVEQALNINYRNTISATFNEKGKQVKVDVDLSNVKEF